MQRKALDEQIARFLELQAWDAELAREHAQTRAEFTEIAVSLKAYCEAYPADKAYVEGELQRGQTHATT